MAMALNRLWDLGNGIRSCVSTMMGRGRGWSGNMGRVRTLGRNEWNVGSGIRAVQSRMSRDDERVG